MLEFVEKTSELSAAPESELTLTFELRQKSRQKVVLADGREAAVVLKRGTVLYDNDLLSARDGTVVRVRASEEQLSMVICSDLLLFARACYHLGNRHAPVQIEPGKLSYLHDHVLDDMLRGLGLEVKQASGPFEPEAGAYGSNRGAVHHHGH